MKESSRGEGPGMRSSSASPPAAGTPPASEEGFAVGERTSTSTISGSFSLSGSVLKGNGKGRLRGVDGVAGEMGLMGVDGGGFKGVEVVGPVLMNRLMSSGVSFGVTFSMTVNEGRTITVVGCGLPSSGAEWYSRGGCKLEAEIINL